MIRIIILLLALPTISYGQHQGCYAPPPRPQYSQPAYESPPRQRCWQLKPLCNVGTRPICLCESDISLRCEWVCGSQ